MIRQNKHLHEEAILKIFTSNECKDIIKIALNNWTEEEGTISNFKKDLDWRNTTLFYPPEADKKSDWFKKINGNIMSFNNDKDSYGFDISGMVEPPCMMRYMAPDINPNKKAGKYDWHIDLGFTQITSMRKISYSILLNTGEYEGGELEFHIGGSEHVSSKDSDFLTDRANSLSENAERFKATRSQQSGPEALGSIILFPSYLVHRVRPITKGTRYAIVGWMHGDSFK